MNCKKRLLLQYKGYQNTPLLWSEDAIYGLYQFPLMIQPKILFQKSLPDRMRLGKRVEQFIGHDLSQSNQVKVIAEGLQIIKNNITHGELDVLLQSSEGYIHMEVVYKFYLFDPTLNDTPLSHWIGPNRKDSLLQKLEKLKQKQLPLLHNPITQESLNPFKVHASDFEQYVYFKAQLFLPISFKERRIENISLNRKCIKGWYMNKKELVDYKMYQFYIPEKQDWLIDPHIDVSWLEYDALLESIEIDLSQQYAPLCWMLSPEKKLTKIFITWW